MTEKIGIKHDSDKIMAGLLADFSRALLAVAEVGTFGAVKYTRQGWLNVPNNHTRYTDAMWRHLLQEGSNMYDSNSGLRHSACMAWNALAKLELELIEAENKTQDKLGYRISKNCNKRDDIIAKFLEKYDFKSKPDNLYLIARIMLLRFTAKIVNFDFFDNCGNKQTIKKNPGEYIGYVDCMTDQLSTMLEIKNLDYEIVIQDLVGINFIRTERIGCCQKITIIDYDKYLGMMWNK